MPCAFARLNCEAPDTQGPHNHIDANAHWGYVWARYRLSLYPDKDRIIRRCMTKAWTRWLMGLVFVFATITAPLHAQAMTAHSGHNGSAMAQVSAAAMSADCAKAMKAQTARDISAKKASNPMDGGCCSYGCNCPLSHCPATPSALAAVLPVLFPMQTSAVEWLMARALPSRLADTQKRPPRA